MNNIKSICIFCGSSEGKDPSFIDAAIATGQYLANQDIRLVYGGASVGMMGALAESCTEHGGNVIGIQPTFLQEYEPVSTALGTIITSEDLYDRKKQMIDLSDAFIILPGGLGTLDELFEVWTQVQLDRQATPIGILNINDFYTPLLQAVTHMQQSGFLNEAIFNYIQVDTNPANLIAKMQQSQKQSFLTKKLAFRKRDTDT